jgi:hypothetical protein
VVPFDRVECIDTEKSTFTTIDKTPERTLYLGLGKVVHRPGCMKGLHLARDIHIDYHLLVSDELRDALAATGEDSMFFRAEDLPLFGA